MSRKSHNDAGHASGSIQRRSVVRGIGSVLGAGVLATSGVPASGVTNATGARSDAAQTEAANGIIQNDDCVTLPPVVGDVPVEEFYKYDEANTRYSSAGPVTALQQDRASRLLVYRGPDDTRSLVVFHGKHRLEDAPEGGGSVSFTFEGLPSGGEWLVQDDNYDGPNLYDEWELGDDQATIHWTWQGGRTDGAVFAGLGDEYSITIEPAFNGDAKLYEEHYPGDVDAWEAVGGSQTDPKVVSLTMDQPVTIESSSC